MKRFFCGCTKMVYITVMMKLLVSKEHHSSYSDRRAAAEEVIKLLRSLIPKDLPTPNLHVLVKKTRSTKSGEFDVRKIAPEICKNFGIPTTSILDVQQRRYNFLLILSVPAEQRDKILIGKPFLKTNDFSVEIRTSIPKMWRVSISHVPFWIGDEHLRHVAVMFGTPKHVVTTSADLVVTTRTIVAFYDTEPIMDFWPADEALQSVKISMAEPMLPQHGVNPDKRQRPSSAPAPPRPTTKAPVVPAPIPPTTVQITQQGQTPPTDNSTRLHSIQTEIDKLKAELATAAGKKQPRKKELETRISELKAEAVSLQSGPKP